MNAPVNGGAASRVHSSPASSEPSGEMKVTVSAFAPALAEVAQAHRRFNTLWQSGPSQRKDRCAWRAAGRSSAAARVFQTAAKSAEGEEVGEALGFAGGPPAVFSWYPLPVFSFTSLSWRATAFSGEAVSFTVTCPAAPILP